MCGGCIPARPDSELLSCNRAALIALGFKTKIDHLRVQSGVPVSCLWLRKRGSAASGRGARGIEGAMPSLRGHATEVLLLPAMCSLRELHLRLEHNRLISGLSRPRCVHVLLSLALYLPAHLGLLRTRQGLCLLNVTIPTPFFRFQPCALWPGGPSSH
ncbi:hypothetical protein BV20DRAFT_390667 [Pilatotrama ljubarskyi]|nr:hypothetical protein BV20DRAFT_390667 [Pilatotrama ljubarskyi]